MSDEIGFIIKKYSIKLALKLIENEGECHSYASEILKKELERIEHERTNQRNS